MNIKNDMSKDLYLDSELKFKKLQNVFSKNLKSSDVNFVKKFSNQGKQGVTGIASVNGEQCVYKVSQNLNFIARHEYEIMKGLNEISEYCPHFCKVYNLIKKKMSGNYKKQKNPFEITSKHPVDMDVIIMEYIESPQFYSMIKNKEITIELLISTIKQLLLAVGIAQNKKQFSHYDLHSCNVLMNKCDRNDVFLYIMDDENQFCIPTNGLYPSIIDFGFSYIENLDNNPIWASLAHTEVGFMTNQFDHVADPKLLLVTMSDELKRYRSSKDINVFRNVVKNIFEPLDIDWESGWDIYGSELGAANYISEHLEKVKINSKIFKKYNHLCIDLIQSLIKLPLSPQSIINIDMVYQLFVNEFEKIENEIGNSFYNLFILKKIIDTARQIKHDYSISTRREAALIYFKREIIDSINKLVKFCNPKNVHWEKMLCSLYVFAQNCEGMLYKLIQNKTEDKKQKYNDITLQELEQIYAAMEVNIPTNYEFNKQSRIYIFDCDNERRDVIKDLPDYMIDFLNETHQLMRGCVLYDYYKGKFDYINDIGND